LTTQKVLESRRTPCPLAAATGEALHAKNAEDTSRCSAEESKRAIIALTWHQRTQRLLHAGADRRECAVRSRSLAGKLCHRDYIIGRSPRLNCGFYGNCAPSAIGRETGIRLSLAALKIRSPCAWKGCVSLPLDGAPSTHILKPAVERFAGLSSMKPTA